MSASKSGAIPATAPHQVARVCALESENDCATADPTSPWVSKSMKAYSSRFGCEPLGLHLVNLLRSNANGAVERYAGAGEQGSE